MKKNLLLQGRPGVGKTTLLLEELLPNRNNCAGFISQHMIKGGEIYGFCIVPFAEAYYPYTLYDSENSRTFLEKSKDGWKKNISVFITEGLKCLHVTEGKRFVVLDEIGGIELLSDGFYKRLKELFSGEIPCIGVVKSVRNYEVMRKELSLDNEYQTVRRDFQGFIEGLSDTEILTVTRNNIMRVRRRVRTFLWGG